ncbi:hypothetical protein [Streptomyces sp. NPDC054863]
MSSQSEPEWWQADPESRPEQDDRDRQMESEAFADAALHMRDAAEALRDATPGPPPKERDWSLDWFWRWVRETENGIAFKRSLYSTGPGLALILMTYSRETGNHGGAAAFFFALIAGVGHLRIQRPFTRLVLWGSVLAPVMYFPALLSIVFGLAGFLVGGL